MATDDTFRALIRRVRAGEEAAAAELVRAYEPEVRRVVRIWLTDPRLGRLFDSVDVCQSVLANFFVRAAAGQFELDEPRQLLHLLVTMARNKLRDLARRLQADCRDLRRQVGSDADLLAVADRRASPARIVAGQELLQRLLQQLSQEERHLAEQRALGCNWGEIARALGVTPDAARMQLSRAINRVARELDLDEVDHE
jgi:RNA polymerase sigma-70 factor (ECF subfamily)